MKYVKGVFSIALCIILAMGSVVNASAEEKVMEFKLGEPVVSVESEAYLYENTSDSKSGEESTIERHERLLSEGWILEEVKVTDYPIVVGNRSASINRANVVIEHVKVVDTTYTQPIRTKTVLTSTILNTIKNGSNLIDVVIGQFEYSWVPTLLGLNTSTVTQFLSRGDTTYKEASTLRVRDVQVKLSKYSQYIRCASADSFEAESTMVMTAYSLGGSPQTKVTVGRSYNTSPHYNDQTFLINQAMAYAQKDDGTYFFETSPLPKKITATVYDSGI